MNMAGDELPPLSSLKEKSEWLVVDQEGNDFYWRQMVMKVKDGEGIVNKSYIFGDFVNDIRKTKNFITLN